MAQVTGGSYFHAPAPHDLVEIYRAIASELEQGYVVRFDLPSDRGLAQKQLHILASHLCRICLPHLDRAILDVAWTTPPVSLPRGGQICSSSVRQNCELILARTPS